MARRKANPAQPIPLEVKADPTKEFFIEMLTRDIELKHAIVDLVDNCADGARRIRKQQPFDGLHVRIETGTDTFVIKDNCGGISEKLARHYAFCFGRPAGTPSVKHSVGQFGVGMKRALFKLGKRAEIESTSAKFAFRVVIDVDDWQNKPEDWTFEFQDPRRPKKGRLFAKGKWGTRIEVSRLHPSVASEFGLENFGIRLGADIAAAHLYTMEKGLKISLNGNRLKGQPLTLQQSKEIKPAYEEMELEGGKVKVRLYAGVSRSKQPREDPKEAGWYIFCNDRLVLGADKSDVTGWIGGRADVPKYHPQYARFRGYAFFDSDDAGLLPWNTTKTGVDENSKCYRTVQQRMMNLMQPVIGFFNAVKDETDRAEEALKTPLRDALQKAPLKKLAELETGDVFVAPKPDVIRDGPRVGKILYKKPLTEIKRVQKALGVGTYHEAGEKTFEHFLRTECDD